MGLVPVVKSLHVLQIFVQQIYVNGVVLQNSDIIMLINNLTYFDCFALLTVCFVNFGRDLQRA